MFFCHIFLLLHFIGVSDTDSGIAEVKIPALNKYNLRTRSIQNRIEAEKKRKNPRREPKPKQKPPPLSKYRRKNANARERTRMQVSERVLVHSFF